ncbi:nucleoid occlusion protein [Limosilactobacillus mucosae]|uniref:Nucleoid occlusion protein n=1 Tax=Limosilactobacillus mucosae TaxID=97478 RepID=A0AAJ1MA97_LIMMU|nr:nucleoid occlusion protein [Limosilactobacillus mucosae]MDD6893246.1 nucleoid occlusion protein [Lactobacillus sp.]MDC2828794.1 nucleoid occlusion protein [Limosilactobacillus mucosae]MDC2836649.1 nucleoid occlusion protein [Limosilactobacillus mucosae]MDC2848829.1 nucleoid occlusion protein [Limosilactobacillus mucosae]MDC2854381.1 nucleoid occlusion protein [Limosilactobacillus mucosae]
MAFSLFGLGKHQAASETKNQVVEIPVAAIVPNQYQPRKVFDQTEIQELAQTISEHGLLQPIVVREFRPGEYEIIAGERRFRAVKLLEWEKIPAIVEKMSDAESASLALIENLQRAQLSPVEEAQAYKQLMEFNNLTQAALAKGMGKSQSFVANKLRLLKLIKPVQNAILDGRITERHGRALLGLDEDQQRTLLMEIVNQHWNVRETEDAVARLLGKPTSAEKAAQQALEQAAEVSDNAEPAQASSEPAKQTAKTPAKKTRAKKKQPKSIKVNDPRIAVNTIKHSIKLVKDSGVAAKVSEKDTEDSYEITIRIPKH